MSEIDGKAVAVPRTDVRDGFVETYCLFVVHRLYCVEHARREQLVVASRVCDGRSVCTDHTMVTNLRSIPMASAEQVGQCEWCRLVPHCAHFVVDELPLCIRHAADEVFVDYDMGAHDMAHAAYLSLRAAGVDDAY